MRIYGLGGIGTDKRVFEYLTLKYELVFIKWIQPLQNEKVENYALRISKTICQKEPFGLLGVSFGGIIAVEISKITVPCFTILLSSIETRNDLGLTYKLIGKIKLGSIIPSKYFLAPKAIIRYFFGAKNLAHLNETLNDTDSKFVKWAINEVMEWKNNEKISNCIKINGTNDKIFKFQKRKDIIPIYNGGHYAVVDKADEISEIINKFTLSIWQN